MPSRAATFKKGEEGSCFKGGTIWNHNVPGHYEGTCLPPPIKMGKKVVALDMGKKQQPTLGEGYRMGGWVEVWCCRPPPCMAPWSICPHSPLAGTPLAFIIKEGSNYTKGATASLDKGTRSDQQIKLDVDVELEFGPRSGFKKPNPVFSLASGPVAHFHSQ